MKGSGEIYSPNQEQLEADNINQIPQSMERCKLVRYSAARTTHVREINLHLQPPVSTRRAKQMVFRREDQAASVPLMI